MMTIEKIAGIERVARFKGERWDAEVQLLCSEVMELCRCGRVVAQLLAVHEAKAQKLRKFRADNPLVELSTQDKADLHTHEMMIKLLLGELPLGPTDKTNKTEEKTV